MKKKLNNQNRNENENRKANLDEVNNWIREENEKRMAEAEALRAKLEREKQELRDFLEQGMITYYLVISLNDSSQINFLTRNSIFIILLINTISF